jgi:hypothetical protein
MVHHELSGLGHRKLLGDLDQELGVGVVRFDVEDGGDRTGHLEARFERGGAEGQDPAHGLWDPFDAALVAPAAWTEAIAAAAATPIGTRGAALVQPMTAAREDPLPLHLSRRTAERGDQC